MFLGRKGFRSEGCDGQFPAPATQGVPKISPGSRWESPVCYPCMHLPYIVSKEYDFPAFQPFISYTRAFPRTCIGIREWEEWTFAADTVRYAEEDGKRLKKMWRDVML